MRKNYVILMRELREDHDLRQKQVAAYLKIDQRVYSRYETGINAMPIEKILMLCKLYNVSADYLLGLDPVKRSLPEPPNKKKGMSHGKNNMERRTGCIEPVKKQQNTPRNPNTGQQKPPQ